jgi:CRP/FNR family transcriptional regulator
MTQEEPATRAFNVVSGSVMLYRNLKDGRKQVTGFALPGDFLGVSIAGLNAFSAAALDNVVLCKFPRGKFDDLVEASPELTRQLHAATTNELTLAQDHVLVLGGGSAAQKVATFLVQHCDRLAKKWVAGANRSTYEQTGYWGLPRPYP